MKRKTLFSDFIYQFQAPKDIITQALELMDKAEWEINVYNLRCPPSLFETKKGKRLRKWFNDCLREVKTDLNLNCDELEVSQIWGNKSTNAQWHHGHMHSNSWASGILYLSESTSSTWFSRKNFWHQGETIHLLKEEKVSVIHKYPTSPGELLVFPSNLYHSVDEHYGQDPRFTLSFNSFPSGFITAMPEANYSATELNLKVL